MLESRAIHKREVAKRDLAELAGYIAEDNPDAAIEFLESAERSFCRLLEFPRLGRAREFSSEELKGLRSWPIPGFPNHLIFYRETADGIEVVRVLHGARDMEALFDESAPG